MANYCLCQKHTKIWRPLLTPNTAGYYTFSSGTLRTAIPNHRTLQTYGVLPHTIIPHHTSSLPGHHTSCHLSLLLHVHLTETLSNWLLLLWSRDCFIKSLKVFHKPGGPVNAQFGLNATKSHQPQQWSEQQRKQSNAWRIGMETSKVIWLVYVKIGFNRPAVFLLNTNQAWKGPLELRYLSQTDLNYPYFLESPEQNTIKECDDISYIKQNWTHSSQVNTQYKWHEN